MPKKIPFLNRDSKEVFLKQNNQIKTKAVITDVYTAWIKGGLTFRDMTFKDICKKLERH